MKVRSVLFFAVMTFMLIACREAQPVPEALLTDYNYAAGEMNFSVALSGVVVQVTDVQVYASDGNIASGYVYVVPAVQVTNQNETAVSSRDFSLVDEYLNEFESWQTNVAFGSQLLTMPEAVKQGETVSANHVFIVPAAALQANLKLRWDSPITLSRIDVSLGNLGAVGQ
ncbi:hypothetical protein MNBD_CHLOROFLEXI01-2139 [hydrothermal vent metagenome]|uniref:DUF4352 domain-containing protein n=1 Tax=hydrothermal vent metagenome TaxID=652676 RepID=A0A3B0VDG2_9ZZZZ